MFYLLTEVTTTTTQAYNPLFDDLHQLLANSSVQSAFSVLIVTVLGYLTVRVNGLKSRNDLDFSENCEMLKGNKRSSLRVEYLGIYNSDKLTNEQKYNLTREIVEEYYALGGNHYITELESNLEKAKKENPDEIVK